MELGGLVAFVLVALARVIVVLVFLALAGFGLGLPAHAGPQVAPTREYKSALIYKKNGKGRM